MLKIYNSVTFQNVYIIFKNVSNQYNSKLHTGENFKYFKIARN